MYDRSASKLRWLVLFLACLSLFGSYYCYDNPTALKQQLTGTYGWRDNVNQKYNLFYSVYSYPNIILPFFGGFFVDRLGTNVTLFTFLTFIVLGQGLFAWGVSIQSYALALVGRVVFGFGGESLSVAQSTLLALWFRGKEVAFAMGINLSVARLGSVVNDNVSPAAFDAWGISWALWLGFFICCVSLSSTCVLISVEMWAEKRASESEREALLGVNTMGEGKGVVDGLDSPTSEKQEEPAEQINFSDIKDFSLSFWLITASCVIVYATVLPFNNVAGDLLQQKYDLSLKKADFFLSIPFTISAVASPFLGGGVDLFGNRARLLVLSAGFIVASHCLLAWTMVTPYVPLIILGFSYSVYAAAIWPSVSYVVLPHQLGTAYGLITAVQNAGLAVTPQIVGAIRDSTGSYHEVEIFFAGVGVIGVLIGIWLNIVDARNNNILNRTAKDAARALKGLEADDDGLLVQPVIDDMDPRGSIEATRMDD